MWIGSEINWLQSGITANSKPPAKKNFLSQLFNPALENSWGTWETEKMLLPLDDPNHLFIFLSCDSGEGRGR